MKLIASMPVRDELGRYLQRAVEHALTYCDEVRVLDNGSTDGGAEWLEAQDRVVVERFAGPGWAESDGHEGAVRQALFEHTLRGEPTHVLAIDADEIVPRGLDLRELVEGCPGQMVHALRVVEAWSEDPWLIRVDGAWKPRFAPVLYRAPVGAADRDRWRVRADMRLACPREPTVIADRYRQAGPGAHTPFDLVHLGWSNPAEREARAARYLEHDRGEFHRSDHLESILWADERVQLTGYELP